MKLHWALFATLFTLVSVFPALGRTWNTQNGRTFDGTFVRVEQNLSVRITGNGGLIHVPFHQFSPVDQEYIRRQLRARGDTQLLEAIESAQSATTNQLPDLAPGDQDQKPGDENSQDSDSQSERFPRDEVRIWTDNIGRQIQARFIRIHLDNVILQQGRKIVPAPLENLSPYDREYLRELMASRGLGHLVPSDEELAERARQHEIARQQNSSLDAMGAGVTASQLAAEVFNNARTAGGSYAPRGGASSGSATSGGGSGEAHASGARSTGPAPTPPPRLPDRPVRPEPAYDPAPYPAGEADPYAGATTDGADATYASDPYTAGEDSYASPPGGGAEGYSNGYRDATRHPYSPYGHSLQDSPATDSGGGYGRYAPPSGAFGSGGYGEGAVDSPGGADVENDGALARASETKSLRAGAATTANLTDTDSQSLMALVVLILVVGIVGIAVCFGYFI